MSMAAKICFCFCGIYCSLAFWLVMPSGDSIINRFIPGYSVPIAMCRSIIVVQELELVDVVVTPTEPKSMWGGLVWINGGTVIARLLWMHADGSSADKALLWSKGFLTPFQGRSSTKRFFQNCGIKLTELIKFQQAYEWRNYLRVSFCKSMANKSCWSTLCWRFGRLFGLILINCNQWGLVRPPCLRQPFKDKYSILLNVET